MQKERYDKMIRPILLFLFMLLAMVVKADGGERELPRFDQMTVADGLHEDNVRHILQLADGRMVVTTWECIHLLDGRKIRQYDASNAPSCTLSNYHGGYHVYADAASRIWMKNDSRLWCLNLRTGSFETTDKLMDDLFVDSRRCVWIVSDTTITEMQDIQNEGSRQTFAFQRKWGELQDLEADSLYLFLFFSSSTVACYDLQSRKLEYTTAPYDTAEAKFYDKTSLVVRSSDGPFYQLRCGERRNIFLRFDPEARQWGTVFETTKGSFHTLCVPTSELALMTCPEGLWEIELNTGKMQLHSEIISSHGDTIRASLNTVFVDKSGGLWIGSYTDGLLHAPSIHASKSYLIYYIVALLLLTILLLGLFFYRYATRQRRREERLMQQLRNLLAVHDESQENVEGEEHKGDSEESREAQSATNTAFSDPFIQRAIALVEQHLDTPGYNVEQLATDLCMERTGLYKRLTALLDQTPTLFIRRIRMERAARLLREGNLSIAEIAEQTGFSSASYFSRIFQETYGKKPSEYAK